MPLRCKTASDEHSPAGGTRGLARAPPSLADASRPHPRQNLRRISTPWSTPRRSSPRVRQRRVQLRVVLREVLPLGPCGSSRLVCRLPTAIEVGADRIARHRVGAHVLDERVAQRARDRRRPNLRRKALVPLDLRSRPKAGGGGEFLPQLLLCMSGGGRGATRGAQRRVWASEAMGVHVCEAPTLLSRQSRSMPPILP